MERRRFLQIGLGALTQSVAGIKTRDYGVLKRTLEIIDRKVGTKIAFPGEFDIWDFDYINPETQKIEDYKKILGRFGLSDGLSTDREVITRMITLVERAFYETYSDFGEEIHDQLLERLGNGKLISSIRQLGNQNVCIDSRLGFDTGEIEKRWKSFGDICKDFEIHFQIDLGELNPELEGFFGTITCEESEHIFIFKNGDPSISLGDDDSIPDHLKISLEEFNNYFENNLQGLYQEIQKRFPKLQKSKKIEIDRGIKSLLLNTTFLTVPREFDEIYRGEIEDIFRAIKGEISIIIK